MNDEVGLGAKTESRPEQLKRIVREARERSQMASLPSAIPGEEANFVATPSGLQGLTPRTLSTYGVESQVPDGSAIKASITPLDSTALGPVFLSYGPALAEGDTYVDEWESFMWVENGTMYNNQYCMVLRFDGEEMAEFHLHMDRDHVDRTYGQFGWVERTPATGPRKLVGSIPMYPVGDLEAPFEIAEHFDVDPAMLRDPVPTEGPALAGDDDPIEGNRALVLGRRQALASGDQAAVDRFYGQGFRHFIAGEAPVGGWDHLPLKDIYAPLVEHLDGPLTYYYTPVFADETRAFERMMSFARLNDGTVWHNWHAFIHEIRGGKIVQTREYLDTGHIWATLARWAPWGKQLPTTRASTRRSNLQGIVATVNYRPNEGPDRLERWHPFPPNS